MGFQEMLEWWNLIYILPLFVSILWLTATVLLGAHDIGHEHDIDADASADMDIDADLDADIDADMDIDADADFDADLDIDADIDSDIDADADTHVSPVHTLQSQLEAHGKELHADLHSSDSMVVRALMLFGVGKVPVTVPFGVFLLSWGVCGMLANRLWGGILRLPALYIWPSLLTTIIVSFAATRGLAEVVGKIMPTSETYGVSRNELIDRVGVVIYAVTDNTGTVDIKDKYGTVHRVMAKTRQSGDTISPDEEVVVIEFDQSDKRFIVERSTL